MAEDLNVRVLKVFEGNAFGLRQPTFLARLRIPVPERTDWAVIDAEMAEISGAPVEMYANSSLSSAPMLRRIGFWTTVVQAQIGLPVFQDPRVLRRQNQGFEIVALLAVPYAPKRVRAAIESLRWSANCIGGLTSGKALERRSATFTGATQALQNRLRAMVPSNNKTPQFLKAANEHEIPWALVTGNVYQFGWGVKARMMDGARTDATGVISRQMYRNKDATAEVLRANGLPAPIHQVARSAADAQRIASLLSYPVVVKPADSDLGARVATDLSTPDQVHAAYLAAAEISGRVLVEKHVNGQDYRLSVFNGELIEAYRRQPGGVIGDGVHTIRELIDRFNADPRRGTGPMSPLKTLKLDAEVDERLRRLDMTFDSIPSSDEFIQLRGAANTSRGGTPIKVDNIHPDNSLLAIDAAAALKLDLAGIDILMEDIATSWHEIGAVICEVNGDPHLDVATHSHLYGQVLEALCRGSGRIPVAVIIGASRANAVAQLVEARFHQQGRVVGVARSAEARVGGRLASALMSDPLVAARLLLADRSVEIALVLIEDDAVLARGLPFDRADALVVVDDLEPVEDGLSRTIRMLEPNSATVIVGSDLDSCHAAVAHLPRSKVRAIASDDGTVASAICDVIEADRSGKPH